MPDPIVGRLRRYWRTPRFLLVFVPGALAWLAVTGWLAWVAFHPVTDWIGGQNEFVQELCGPLAVVAWAAVLSVGLGGIAHFAEGAAGLRPGAEAWPPGPVPAGAKKWARGRNTLPAASEARAD
jgi:hypothetical protein